MYHLLGNQRSGLFSPRKAHSRFQDTRNFAIPEQECTKVFKTGQNYRKLMFGRKQISPGGVLAFIFARAFFKSFKRSSADAYVFYMKTPICVTGFIRFLTSNYMG